MIDLLGSFSVERCVGEEIEEKQCYSLLIAKNVFKALGQGPFTSQVIGLSPLVAKMIQMIISFEDDTNFVRYVTKSPHYEETTDGSPQNIFSLSVNYTAIEEQKLSNIKVVLKAGINELGQLVEQLTVCPRVIV